MRRDAGPGVQVRTSAPLAVTLAVPGYREFAFGAEYVDVPALDGAHVIEPGHHRLEAPLGIGVLTVRAGGRQWLAALHGGVVRVRDDEVRLLAEALEFADRIDVTRAKAAQSDAAQRLTNNHADSGARAALRRANLRLAVAARVHP
ncbi:F0F1 ATP synthase subunit epsilon [Nocardia colli]|uniref:ATP synthase epsilon chain n=1 Tax=Nocardia colli TaxID=2545717 RepID=A0A5N0EJT0_9NOCA|nr:F0F1 ATP synthase subunit epsilon [Nocardia colli]KAA8888524.1 F0F1 ATP synthase subunit epsilon [Nocardia colli]